MSNRVTITRNTGLELLKKDHTAFENHMVILPSDFCNFVIFSGYLSLNDIPIENKFLVVVGQTLYKKYSGNEIKDFMEDIEVFNPLVKIVFYGDSSLVSKEDVFYCNVAKTESIDVDYKNILNLALNL